MSEKDQLLEALIKAVAEWRASDERDTDRAIELENAIVDALDALSLVRAPT